LLQWADQLLHISVSTDDCELCGSGVGRTTQSELLAPRRSPLPLSTWPPPGENSPVDGSLSPVELQQA
jgi:hypothetical protein